MLSDYINQIQSPDDLSMLQYHPRVMYDADNDGIEDIRIDTSEQLDKFYHPAVFGIAEYENNTHHGGLPGFVQKGFDLTQGEPVNTYDLV